MTSKRNLFSLKPLVAAIVLAGSQPAHAEDLLQIFQLASQNDPTVRAAAATRNATLENRPIAKASLLPTVNASASATNKYHSQDFNGKSYALSLTQSVYDASNYAGLRKADEQVAQAEAEYGAAEQDLIIRVAETYFDVLRATDDLEFQRADKSAISRQLEQARKRYEVGLIAITDVHEAQARYDQAIAGEIAAANALDAELENLREITGQVHQSVNPLGETLSLDLPEPADMQAWVNAAMEQNLTLLAAVKAAEAAREETSVQRAGHYPTLDLVASTSRSDDAGSSPSGVSDDSSIGLQLTVPIYSGGATSARTRAAEYAYVAAQENREFAQRGAQADTRDAYRGVESAISRVNALAQVVVSSQSALDATEAGFEVGTRTIVDVLNAQRTLYGSIRDLKSARYDYLLNGLRLKQAAGSLAVKDVEGINTLLR